MNGTFRKVMRKHIKYSRLKSYLSQIAVLIAYTVDFPAGYIFCSFVPMTRIFFKDHHLQACILALNFYPPTIKIKHQFYCVRKTSGNYIAYIIVCLLLTSEDF